MLKVRLRKIVGLHRGGRKVEDVLLIVHRPGVAGGRSVARKNHGSEQRVNPPGNRSLGER